MSELLPAAQAALDAANDTFDRAGTTAQGVAAALRAAVDEVISSAALGIGGYDGYAQGFLAAQLKYRGKFLEIIAELEAQ